MNFNEPGSYISIISTVFLILSEVLPFLSCKSNGLFDFVITFFKNNQKCIEDKANKIIDINKSHELTSIVTHYTEELLIIRHFKLELEKMLQEINDNKIDRNGIKNNIQKMLDEIKVSNEKHKK